LNKDLTFKQKIKIIIALMFIFIFIFLSPIIELDDFKKVMMWMNDK